MLAIVQCNCSLDIHMPRSSGARRIIKWTGAGLSLLLVATWVGSLWCIARLVFTPYTNVWIHSGSIGLIDAEFDVAGEWNFYTGVRRDRYSGSGFRLPEYRRWQTELRRFIPLENVETFAPRTGVYSVVRVPLWLPFLLIVIPTAWLWRRDRRGFPPGHCSRCGYNLTGNISGVCSECGLVATTTELEKLGR